MKILLLFIKYSYYLLFLLIILVVEAQSTIDSERPAPINDLTVGFQGPRAIRIGWTATGDCGQVGTAAEYIVKYFHSPITWKNWRDATRVRNNVPIPSPPGSREGMLVTGLKPGKVYYFAIRVKDDARKFSPVSNSPMGKTQLLRESRELGEEPSCTTLPRLPTGTQEWQSLGLIIPKQTDIHQYRIQLISERWVQGWTPWYKTGENDVDTQKSSDGSSRRYWALFDTYPHEVQICEGEYINQPPYPEAPTNLTATETTYDGALGVVKLTWRDDNNRLIDAFPDSATGFTTRAFSGNLVTGEVTAGISDLWESFVGFFRSLFGLQKRGAIVAENIYYHIDRQEGENPFILNFATANARQHCGNGVCTYYDNNPPVNSSYRVHAADSIGDAGLVSLPSNRARYIKSFPIQQKNVTNVTGEIIPTNQTNLTKEIIPPNYNETMPDLIIRNPKVDFNTLSAISPIVIVAADIVNIGGVTANNVRSRVEFFNHGGGTIQYTRIGHGILSAGKSTQTGVQWPMEYGKTYDIVISVDEDQLIAEANETNNNVTITRTMPPRPQPVNQTAVNQTVNNQTNSSA